MRQIKCMSGITQLIQKYYKKHDNINYICKNYALKYVYSDENERNSNMLSHDNQDLTTLSPFR